MPLLAGSDVLDPHVYPGFSLHEEISALVEAGLSPRSAVAAATTAPTRFLQATDSLGSIAVGQLADLVLLDANPLTDVHNASRIRAVVVNGHLLTRKESSPPAARSPGVCQSTLNARQELAACDCAA